MTIRLTFEKFQQAGQRVLDTTKDIVDWYRSGGDTLGKDERKGAREGESKFVQQTKSV